MKLVSALCEDNKKKKSSIRLQVTFFTKLQNRSFQVVNWRKRGREMHLIEKMHLQSVQNCSLSWTHQVCQHFCYASEAHTYNTRYASKSNFYKSRFRTKIGKQTTSAMATEMWKQLLSHIKHDSTYNFPKKLKEYLLAEQLVY